MELDHLFLKSWKPIILINIPNSNNITVRSSRFKFQIRPINLSSRIRFPYWVNNLCSYVNLSCHYSCPYKTSDSIHNTSSSNNCSSRSSSCHSSCSSCSYSLYYGQTSSHRRAACYNYCSCPNNSYCCYFECFAKAPFCFIQSFFPWLNSFLNFLIKFITLVLAIEHCLILLLDAFLVSYSVLFLLLLNSFLHLLLIIVINVLI